jgi:hypothetical protein
MNSKKIPLFLFASVIALQIWGQENYRDTKLQSKASCRIFAYATPSTIEQGLSTTLQVFTNDTLYSVSWAPSASLTYPDSSTTTAYPKTTTTYTVTANTSCGTFVDTVTVYIKCTVAANIIIMSYYYCPANPGKAEAVGYQGLAPYSYAWSNGQTTTRVSGLSAGSYTLTVKDSNACSVSDTFSIPVKAITLGAAAKPVTIEPGDSSYLHAIQNDPGLSNTISWSPSATVRHPNSAGTYAFPTTTTTYTVTMTTLCGTFSDTVTVHIGCSVTVSISTTPFYCTTEGGTATTTVSTGVPPYAYIWSDGETTANVKGLSAGTYSLIVNDSYGCSTSGSAKIDSAIFLSATAKPNSVNPGDSTHLIASIKDTGSSSHTYSWKPSASVTHPDSVSTYAHPAITTIYTITTTSSCGNITDTVTVHVISPTGIGQILSSESSMIISPNPGNGIFEITYSLLKDENIKWSIMDEFGRIVYEEQFSNQHSGVSKQLLNIQNMAEGVYFLRMATDEGIMVRKVVVLKSR